MARGFGLFPPRRMCGAHKQQSDGHKVEVSSSCNGPLPVAEMEGEKRLERAFDEAESVLREEEEKSVAVWPATTIGFKEELQTMTEGEWNELLRGGRRLAVDVEVKELYCFQNIAECDGLVARVLLLHPGDQSPRRQKGTRLWKVQQTPVVIRRRIGASKETKQQEESHGAASTVKESPFRTTKTTTSKTISPEEMQKKRRRVDDTLPLDVEEVRPPAKTRRLYGKERRKRVMPVRMSKRLRDKAENTRESKKEQAKPRDNKDSAAIVALGLIPVDRGTESSESSSPTGSETDNSPSDTSSGLQSDADTHEDRAKQTLSAVQQPSKTFGDGDTFFSTLQQVISAGLGLDSEDEDADEGHASQTKPFSRTESRSECASASSHFNPFWSIFATASTQVHKLLSGLSSLPSNLAAFTAQDSLDYDLLWVEGKDHKHWTMFGEPSTPQSVKTKRQHRETKRSGTTWRCW